MSTSPAEKLIARVEHLERCVRILSKGTHIALPDEAPAAPAAHVVQHRPDLIAFDKTLATACARALAALEHTYQFDQDTDPRPAYRAAVTARRRLQAFRAEAFALTNDAERFSPATLPVSPERLTAYESIRMRVGEDRSTVDRADWAHLLPDPQLVR